LFFQCYHQIHKPKDCYLLAKQISYTVPSSTAIPLKPVTLTAIYTFTPRFTTSTTATICPGEHKYWTITEPFTLTIPLYVTPITTTVYEGEGTLTYTISPGLTNVKGFETFEVTSFGTEALVARGEVHDSTLTLVATYGRCPNVTTTTITTRYVPQLSLIKSILSATAMRGVHEESLSIGIGNTAIVSGRLSESLVLTNGQGTFTLTLSLNCENSVANAMVWNVSRTLTITVTNSVATLKMISDSITSTTVTTIAHGLADVVRGIVGLVVYLIKSVLGQ
jgi:hypothetical protein